MAKYSKLSSSENSIEREANSTTWESAVSFRLFADGKQPTVTVHEQIALAVGERIISGALPPRTRVVEQDLAAEFGVSRGPARDAIRVLEREGLVTILPRRGAIVTDLLAEEVREIFEIRAGLLEIVARKVAERRDPHLLEVLQAGVARLERLANMVDDQGAYAESGYRLTLLCVRSCGNQRLARMLVGISLQTLRYSKLSLASRERRQQSARLWRQAVDALVAGDDQAYARLARQRVEESGAEAARLLDAASPSETRVAKVAAKV